MNTQDFLSWSTLSTYTGALFATTLLTQLLKEAPFICKIATRIVSYCIAVLVLLAGTFFAGQFTLENAAICFVNAALISLASNGTFEAVQKSPNGKSEDQK